MKSLTTPEFWEAYSALSPKVQEQAQKAYQLWLSDPFYPSLHSKKVGDNLWSVRVSRSHRALAIKEGDDYYWIWIGAHDEYEFLIQN
ncbi:hypothetical protein [Phormidesmis priestleyi]|uniref:ParE family toxin-like protein n=1 Tax=Phormidesmis priestleyi TaxID=268141 RepID=UPI00083AC5DA|nr:hypothetical protein [Phormidesmis priestleyi]